MAEFELKSSRFRREREASWRELERLIARVESAGVRRLGAVELRRLPMLYRSAVSSLSVARAISLDRNLLDYLENLVRRSYVAVYTVKRPALAAVRRFVARELPATVRAYRWSLAAACAVLAIGVLCGLLIVGSDPQRYYGLVPAQTAQGRTPDTPTEELRRILYDAPSHVEGGRAAAALHLFATFLFTHNAQIGILCFALGFAAGAPTIVLLFVNGLQLGALAAVYQAHGLGAEFWAWVLPHGITELGAVCLCGMAGLVIGRALVFPGELTRIANLAHHGRRVAMVVIGAVGMFFVAALIEGFFRQLVHDPTVRGSVAGASLLLWTAYFALGGRSRRDA